jgi:hypothetical protein
MAIRIFLFASILAVSGCASLRIETADSTGAKAAKVMARVPLAVMSLGASELAYACDRSADPVACRQQVSQAYVQSGQQMMHRAELERQRQHEQQLEMMRSWNSRRPIQCTSSSSSNGTSVYTTCY